MTSQLQHLIKILEFLVKLLRNFRRNFRNDGILDGILNEIASSFVSFTPHNDGILEFLMLFKIVNYIYC